jgi:hypothetical protein
MDKLVKFKKASYTKEKAPMNCNVQRSIWILISVSLYILAP